MLSQVVCWIAKCDSRTLVRPVHDPNPCAGALCFPALSGATTATPMPSPVRSQSTPPDLCPLEPPLGGTAEPSSPCSDPSRNGRSGSCALPHTDGWLSHIHRRSCQRRPTRES